MAALRPVVSEVVGDKPVASCLNATDAALNEDIKEVIMNASLRWLKNDEVLSVLEGFQIEDVEWPREAADKPQGGTLYVFSRKTCRAFRNDKHSWRKKQDGRTVKETHEKLKVGDRERLNCYYAHAEGNEGLQRRCYWILEPAKDDVVLVHYLCSSTSRASARGSAAAVYPTIAGSQRPRRAAAQRARYGGFNTLLASDDERSLPAANIPNIEENLSREQSQGANVQVQLAPSAKTVPAAAVVEAGTGTAGSLQSPQSLLRDNSITGISFIDRMQVMPEWHDLPSLQEIYANHKKGGGGGGGRQPTPAGPGLLQVSQAQARAVASGRAGPASPTKSPQRRLAHDPLGSFSILHSDFSMLMDSLPFADNRPYAPISSLSPQRRDGDLDEVHAPEAAVVVEEEGGEENVGLLRGMSQLDTLSGMLVPSSNLILQRSLGMEGDPESPGSKLMYSTGVMFPGKAGSGSLTLAAVDATNAGPSGNAPDTGGAQQQQPASASASAQRRELPGEPSSTEPRQHSNQQKVETLRRIVAPSFRRRDQSPSIADLAMRSSPAASGAPRVAGKPGSIHQRIIGSTPQSDSDDPSTHANQHRRKNPIALPSPLSHTDRVAAAAAHAAADAAAQREEKLRELRQARGGQTRKSTTAGVASGGVTVVEEDLVELIEPGVNPFFRIRSHLVGVTGSGSGAAVAAAAAAVQEVDAEATATELLKQMSIELKRGPPEIDDEGGAATLLLRNMSIDDRGGGDGIEQAEVITATAPPSLSRVPLGVDRPSEGHNRAAEFGSEQEVATRSHTNTTADFSDEHASRDPSLSSLLDATLNMEILPQQQQQQMKGVEASGEGEDKAQAVQSGSSVDERLQAAFAVHAARKAAKAGQ